MGLNYRVVLLLPAEEERRLRAWLSQTGALAELPLPFGICATLDFPLDEVIRAYLARTSSPGQHPPTVPLGAMGRVGYFYLDTLHRTASEWGFLRFTAATTRMSRLLQQSPAIRKWFLELSRA